MNKEGHHGTRDREREPKPLPVDPFATPYTSNLTDPCTKVAFRKYFMKKKSYNILITKKYFLKKKKKKKN
jgi:hypothetical protein